MKIPDPPHAETIGKYQVHSVLGRGGMGTVFEASDPVLHRKVALKTLIPGFTDTPELRDRFLREAQAAGKLHHHNLVTVYDFGEHEGQPFIAMEFVEGTDLDRLIRDRQAVPIEWKLDVLQQICAGLSYAHRAGVVHRDMKPGNIRVTPQGEVKIMDFGLALLRSSKMAKDGQVMGTVHYSAPEQLIDDDVDHRADIFSVGAIAFEMLSLRRPHEAESITEVMYKIAHEDPDRSALPSTVYSPLLEAIVMKAMDRDREGRYQDLEEMRADIERLVREKGPDTTKKMETEPRNGAASSPPSRAEGEIAEIRAEIERARAEGHYQRAQALCRRLIEIDPEDGGAKTLSKEIGAAIQEKEVEELCTLALSYAADGDLELAGKIATKIQRLNPDSARYNHLREYLHEETSRTSADALIGTAQQYLAMGKLDEALAGAEEALSIYPGHSVAREIRDRIHQLAPAEPQPVPIPASPAEPARPIESHLDLLDAIGPMPVDMGAPPPDMAVSSLVSSPEPAALTPLPEGPVQNVEANALVENARRHLRDRAPQKALPLLEGAAALEPSHSGLERLLKVTRLQARKAEAESLTTAALNFFVQNKYPQARKTAKQALELEPSNKKARELMKILESLG